MNFLDALLTGSQSSEVSPELLETLGKQAAARFIQYGEPLNDSIVKLASEHSQLENEHLKRIAEFANNETFQHKFQNDEDKNVHFDVADPGVIIRDLKDGGSPKHDGKVLNTANKKTKNSEIPATDASFGGSSDYRSDPQNVQTQDGNGFADLTSAFAENNRQDQYSGAAGNGEAIAKTASVHVHTAGAHANPIDDVYDQHVVLQAAEQKLAQVHSDFSNALSTAQEDFYKIAKREVMSYDGAGLSGVTQAVKVAAPSDSLAFSILTPVVEKLVKSGAITKSMMTKTGHEFVPRVLNTEHPLVSAVSGIVKAAQEKTRAATALQEVQDCLAQTSSFLRGVAG